MTSVTLNLGAEDVLYQLSQAEPGELSVPFQPPALPRGSRNF